MSTLKRILLIGPISSSGGREVMTNLLVNSLKDHYCVAVFSTILMTRHSVALRTFNGRWSNLNLTLLKSNLFIRILALLSRARSKRDAPLSEFSVNSVSRKLFDFEKRSKSIVKDKVLSNDFVIYSGEINNNWYKFIAEQCHKSNIPLLLRLTGQVNEVPDYFRTTVFPLNILAHSIKNKNKLEGYEAIKIWQVDQTTVLEKELLRLEIKCNQDLTFGFLGRFTEEKGINELLDCFKEREDKLIIAGSGKFIKSVQDLDRQCDNLLFIGKLTQHEISNFFSQIDVLIIPSVIEGGPIVGVEAMAAGKLIISTRVGAMEERLKDTSNDFWFDHNDHNGLNNCIDKIKELPVERHIEIRESIRKRYMQRNQLRVIQHTYRSIIEKISS